MLDKFRTQKIIWDKANNEIFEKVEAHSGDSNGRKLTVQVLNNGMIESLTDCTLSLAWQTKDKAHYGLDAFKAIDIAQGLFEIYYTTGMLSNTGELKASFVLMDSKGRIESKSFEIIVYNSMVDDKAVQSDNSFTALTEALIKVSKYQDEIDNIKTDIINQGNALISTEQEKLDNLYTEKESKLDTLHQDKLNALNSLHNTEKAELDALEQDYADKATNLETTYAPRLTAVENMKIGGRNLARGTSKHFILEGDNTSKQTVYCFYPIDGTILSNKEVAISFKWRIISETGTGKFNLQTTGPQWLHFPSGGIDVSSLEGTHTQIFKFGSNMEFTGIGIRADYLVGTLEIYDVKFEFGNKPTDWTPAPEDVQEQIDTHLADYANFKEVTVIDFPFSMARDAGGSYIIKSGNVVTLILCVQKPDESVWAKGYQLNIGTLPIGYRPSRAIIATTGLADREWTVNAAGYAYISTDGNILVKNDANTTTKIIYLTVSFVTEE